MIRLSWGRSTIVTDIFESSDDVPDGVRVLRGRIRDYRKARAIEAFFLGDFDQSATGLAAVAAVAAGMSGLGAGLMSLGGEEEEADLVEFTLDGHEQVQGFVWKSPFKEGDQVEVVAQKVGSVAIPVELT